MDPDRDHSPDDSAADATICPKCGAVLQLADFPFCPHGSTRPSFALGFDPVVVHFNPKTGTYSVPGATDAKVKPGYVRQELRTFAEMDAVTRRMNAIDRRKVDARISREQRHLEAVEKHNRSDLYAAMPGMPRVVRELARLAIEKNNATRPQAYDPGCHFEVREFDRSNREAHADKNTGWKRRY